MRTGLPTRNGAGLWYLWYGAVADGSVGPPAPHTHGYPDRAGSWHWGLFWGQHHTLFRLCYCTVYCDFSVF